MNEYITDKERQYYKSEKLLKESKNKEWMTECKNEIRNKGEEEIKILQKN